MVPVEEVFKHVGFGFADLGLFGLRENRGENSCEATEKMISTGINLVMTVIGFAVSTMFIVFVCTRLVCARIHLNSSRRSFPIASRSDLSILERGLHGLEPVVVATFPTKLYSDECFSASADTQCSVCLGEYHREDVLRILPYCGHSFHVNCIDIWLQQHSTCPVCRISQRDSSDRKRLMQPLHSPATRSPYGADTRSYSYILTPNGFPSRTRDNHGIDPIQEDHCASLGDTDETAIDMNPVPEGTPMTKGHLKKHVESPSNPQIQ
ncbi:PREDICTED: RING-H2 finger protein ATL74-like isoform X1 [Tarenaya hassleriana]|uniref:RING-H2 finger protein ATL74-like isoform X1 n=1 Tax=Tarenaya hassleriana TaxID=28532 RepID=UPI00053C10E2|nr:PREDICTED: RING-H2 finger protein ATL74-like isoform X1 [Tarenaya hassleriana]